MGADIISVFNPPKEENISEKYWLYQDGTLCQYFETLEEAKRIGKLRKRLKPECNIEIVYILSEKLGIEF